MKKSIFLKAAGTFVLCSAFLASFTGCSKKSEPASSEEKTETSDAERPLDETSSNSDLILAGYTVDGGNNGPSEGAATAHQKYLSDPMKFKPVPTQNVEKGDTFVIASDFAMLYSEDNFNISARDSIRIYATIKDPDNMKGTPIPFASLVEDLHVQVFNDDPDLNQYCNKMFNFQDNWNWFYKINYQGKIGYVYGADLYNKSDFSKNCISAEIYRTNGKFEDFFPISGFTPLTDKVVSGLEKDKLVIQKTELPRYVYEDDMLIEYTHISNDIFRPIFITTDLAAHCQHLVFDQMLQYAEQEYFLPRLLNITQNFIAAIKSDTDVPEDIKNIALTYFQVPEALLRLSPTKSYNEESYPPELVWIPADKDAILSEYSENVQNIINQILDASSVSPITYLGDDPIKEDFSQYKPRGHYTKNGILEAYFRAEMWYGHIHFAIAQPEDSIEKDKKHQLEQTAFYITNLVQKNPSLYTIWEQLFTPITDLIGYSDDLGFEDVLPVWKDNNVSSFKEWIQSKDNLFAIMKECHSKLRPPAISGASFVQGGATDNNDITKPAMGWRFLGQRFTWDSYIHNQVSAPRLMSRDIVSGLDIMKVFGSRTADWLLQQSEYPSKTGLEERLNGLQAQFSAQNDNFWNSTYYNSVLAQIKAQADFEQGAGFYFTETPKWNVKSLIAAHGTWAELRHDTILYVKQSCAERAGDGDFEPTFRIKPIPKPTNYVEPNIKFWQISLDSINKLIEIYNKYELMDHETDYTLRELKEIYEKCLEISKLETQDLPVSSNDNTWITTIPRYLANAVMIHNHNGYSSDEDQYKMSTVADVFTNGELEVCLEVGTGRPYRIYVPLNDGQGGKRIAVGATFSYYEFLQPQTNRLNDKEWKLQVYNNNNDFYLDEKMPFWEKGSITEYEKEKSPY